MKVKIIFLSIIIIIMFSSCASVEFKKNDIVENIIVDNYSEELDRFVPEAPFSWTYMGFSNYVQVMSIMKVFDVENKKIYKIEGEVKDTTKGNYSNNFVINITYTVTNDSIIQDKIEEVMMDSEFNKITLLKLPLKVGNVWNEYVYDLDGNRKKLTSKIVDIKGTSPNRIIEVEYKVSENNYLESRKIKENIGIIEFTKSIKYDSEVFDFGYKLEKYSKGINISNILDENVEVKNEDGAQSEIKSEKNVSASLIEILKKLIYDFDDAWIRYINDKDESIFEYLYENGSAYNIIKKYNNVTFKEQFEEVRIDKVEVFDNTAKVYVYERLVKIDNNVEKIFEYNWIYNLIKVDNHWKINFYEKRK